MNLFLKTWLVLAVLWVLAACSSHPARPDCQSHLRPINAPASVAALRTAKP